MTINRFSGPTVLVAEDHPLHRRRLRRDLTRAGARVVDVCDGEEAVRRIVEGASFELVLLGIDTPRMDGIDGVTAAWLIRQKDRVVRGGTVGAVVGMTEGELPTGEDALWFDALIAKPLGREALARLLEPCRRRARSRSWGCELRGTG